MMVFTVHCIYCLYCNVSGLVVLLLNKFDLIRRQSKVAHGVQCELKQYFNT